MTSALVFIDTETTGLDTNDEIWEVAAIRREPDGTEDAHVFQVEHSVLRCAKLPSTFSQDHVRRWNTLTALTLREANVRLTSIFRDRPHLVAANPAFDARFLAKLVDPVWHYHLIDVEAMALGYLGFPNLFPELPYKSDDISRLCGVEPPVGDRHTAEGDVQWVMRWFDKMAGISG